MTLRLFFFGKTKARTVRRCYRTREKEHAIRLTRFRGQQETSRVLRIPRTTIQYWCKSNRKIRCNQQHKQRGRKTILSLEQEKEILQSVEVLRSQGKAVHANDIREKEIQ